MTKLKAFVICVICCIQLTAENPSELVTPYLIPEDHAAKIALDEIFEKQNPLHDAESLRKAGFKFRLRKDRFMIVAGHKKLKGYKVKLYLENQRLREGEWVQWIKRVQGADCIRNSIADHGYQQLLRVPQKWIYPIPPKAVANRRYLLIVEDMHIVTHGKNAAKYRFMMTEELLEALFVVLKENRLIDSMYLDNIPFCKDHTVAFIDTEHFNTHLKPMNYDQMLPRLSPPMQKFWKSLVEKYK